ISSQITRKNFFISRIKTNLKLYKAVSETYAIYERLDLKKLLSQDSDSVDQQVYIGTESCNKLKIRLVGNKLSDEIVTKRIKKAIIQNKGEDIDSYKRQLLHWNLMITSISKEILNTSIITELYRIRWQIELLFKVVKSTLSLDKMHVGKTKYVEAILRIGKLALYEKRLRQTTYSKIEGYLEQLIVAGKT
uniref:transposase n=1 Tax=Cellulosilyticum ruminicola TaxID=425254 RepID=UPI00155DC1A7